MSGLRILHLLSQTQLTGAEVYAQNLISSQVQDKHHVVVISDKIHVSIPVPWISLPISENNFWSRRQNIAQVREILLKDKIDVIHAHSRAAVRIADRVRSGLRKKIALVSTLHGRQHSSWGKRLRDSYGERKLLVCENLIPQMIEDFGVQASSIKVLRNPFDLESWSKPPAQSKTQTWAFVGRSSGPKGKAFVELFRKGLGQFLLRHPDLKFEIVSSHFENFGEPFLAEIRDWKNKNQIQIRDHISHLQTEYPRFDLVFGAGRVAVEACLSGCSVLSFGEFTSHGLLTKKNLKENLASNFGDMGQGPGHFDFPSLLLELQEIFDSPKQQSEILALQQNLRLEFDSMKINREILETYREALFLRNVPAGVPILMYHKVPDQELQSPHRIFVTKKLFEKHLSFFRSRGLETLNFSDLSQYWRGLKSYDSFPRKPFILSFDDGYQDNLTNALPLLQKYNFKAVLYLLSQNNFRENTWDTQHGDQASPLMNPKERRLIADSGYFEIGAHGTDHSRFTDLSPTDVLQQMLESKAKLQAEFGQDIISLAYPFGSTNPEIAGLARQSGFEFAVNTDQGGLHLADNRWSLFRVNIFPEDGLFQIWKKSSTWYRRYFHFKKHR